MQPNSNPASATLGRPTHEQQKQNSQRVEMAPARKKKSSGAPPVSVDRTADAPPGSSLSQETRHIVSTVEKLPVNVLCHIFEDYGATEIGNNSLETLLLVCKSWSEVAQGHSRLWSTFRLALGDISSLKMWRHRVRRRLRRCSANHLYDIQITSHPQSKSDITDVKIFNQILSLLAGPNGTLARRWRVFKTKHPLNSASNLASCLSFPTPNLVELDIEGLNSTRPILPVTRSLKIFRGFDNTMAFPPDLSTVIELETDPNEWGERGLASAVNIVQLRTNYLYHKPYSLPGTFPMLTTLSLSWLTLEDANSGYVLHRELGDLEAPALRRLTLCAASGTDFVLVNRCRGLPLHLLEEVEINCRQPIIQGYRPVEFFRDGLRSFLVMLTSLRVLDLKGPLVPSLVVKMLAEDCDTLLPDPSLRLKLQRKEIELGSGKDRVVNLKGLLRGCKHVRGKWEEIYEEFEWITDVTDQRIFKKI